MFQCPCAAYIEAKDLECSPRAQVGDVFVMMIASLDEGQILTAPLRFWEKSKVQTKLYMFCTIRNRNK